MHGSGGAEAAVKIGLGLADQRHRASPGGQGLLQLAQATAFQAIQPRARAAAGGSVVEPFLAIDVDQIDDRGDALQLGRPQVRDQAGGRRQHRVETRVAAPFPHDGAQIRRAERTLAGGAAGQERAQGAHVPGPASQRDDRHAFGEFLQPDPGLRLDRLIRETGQVDIGPLREMAENMKRADAIALVRRERNTVDKEKDITFRFDHRAFNSVATRELRRGPKWPSRRHARFARRWGCTAACPSRRTECRPRCCMQYTG